MAQPVRDLPHAPHKPSAPPDKPAAKSIVREYAEAFAVALVLALLLRTFLIQAYKIPSGSMEPTLLVGDHILVNKLAYGLRFPDSIFGLKPFADELPYGRYLFHIEPVRRGDIVVFVFPPDPTKDFIKRVIAVGGDKLQITNGTIYLNGRKMDDPHAHYEIARDDRVALSPRDNFGPVTVPAGKIFVMGDNRDRSYDSRFWGYVNEDRVEGHAMIIYWSWDGESDAAVAVRWGRFGRILN